MPLNDLIKEYSLRTIEQQTNISTNNLLKLSNKEWDKLQKAHVSGFINILEREYGIDLSDLKEEANSFYATHKAPQINRPIDLVDASSVSGSGSKIVTNIVTLLTLALIAYASWFYFLKADDNQSSDSSSQSGMFGDTLEGVKNMIGLNDSKESTLNTTQGSSAKESSAEGQKAANNAEANRSAEVNKTATKENKTAMENGVMQEDKAISKESSVAQKTVMEESSSVQEPNVTTFATDNSAAASRSEEAMGSEIAASEVSAQSELPDANGSKPTVKSQVDALISQEETNATLEQNDTAKKSATDLNSSSLEVASDNNGSVQSVQDAVIESITVVPKSKRLWLGIYDLKSHKKISKIVKHSFILSVTGKLALITGHSHLVIKGSGMEPLNFAKTRKGRLYLLVSKSGVKEITKSEYKAVTKKRAW